MFTRIHAKTLRPSKWILVSTVLATCFLFGCAQKTITATQTNFDSSAEKNYFAQIKASIRKNIELPTGIQGNPESVFRVQQLPSGEVVEVNLRKSSGNDLLDQAVISAIRKSSPLPLPANRSADRFIDITYIPFSDDKATSQYKLKLGSVIRNRLSYMPVNATPGFLVTLTASGSSKVELVEPSGNTSVDEKTLEAVREAVKLTLPPPSLQGKDLQIPIRVRVVK